MTKQLLIFLTVLACMACGPTSRAGDTKDAAVKKQYNLAIYGYNYTDFSIGSFEVDGRGGGNLVVSDGYRGGGKSTCCVTFNPVVDAKKIYLIQWTHGDGLWCRQELIITGEIPPNPEYFQVHFYRDGHVELAITSDITPARVELPAFTRGRRYENLADNISSDKQFAKCQNERY